MPQNNPSWDEPGQRDLSIPGIAHEAVILFPRGAEMAGRVACSTALFAGEMVVSRSFFTFFTTTQHSTAQHSTAQHNTT